MVTRPTPVVHVKNLASSMVRSSPQRVLERMIDAHQGLGHTGHGGEVADDAAGGRALRDAVGVVVGLLGGVLGAGRQNLRQQVQLLVLLRQLQPLRTWRASPAA